MTADQAKAVAQSLGQQLQYEWMSTYKVIKAVPEDQQDFKPEANSRSAGELARHLASSDVLFLDGIIKGSFSDWKEDTSAVTIAEVADGYKQGFPQRLEQVLALDGAALAQEIEFFGMKFPAAQYLVLTLAHMVHHRGQLTTYLRPMGSKVPSLYGGSFDEPFKG